MHFIFQKGEEFTFGVPPLCKKQLISASGVNETLEDRH